MLPIGGRAGAAAQALTPSAACDIAVDRPNHSYRLFAARRHKHAIIIMLAIKRETLKKTII